MNLNFCVEVHPNILLLDLTSNLTSDLTLTSTSEVKSLNSYNLVIFQAMDLKFGMALHIGNLSLDLTSIMTSDSFMKTASEVKHLKQS